MALAEIVEGSAERAAFLRERAAPGNFGAWLRSQAACSEAVAWVGGKSLAEAWAACDVVDWMFWLMMAWSPATHELVILVDDDTTPDALRTIAREWKP